MWAELTATAVGNIIGKELFKRDNQNIGTVSSNMYAVMGNYGITDKLNVLFGLPYISTKASAGTLHSSNRHTGFFFMA